MDGQQEVEETRHPSLPPQGMDFEGGKKGLGGEGRARGWGLAPKELHFHLPPQASGGGKGPGGSPQSRMGTLLTFLQDVLGPVLPLVLILVLVIHVWGESGW